MCPVRTREFLACPARFERATYALEALKMRLNNTKNKGIKVLRFGVAWAPRTLALGGITWKLGGIDRQSNGLKWDLSA